MNNRKTPFLSRFSSLWQKDIPKKEEEPIRNRDVKSPSDFAKLINGNKPYVDKSLFISKVQAQINSVTGKTHVLSFPAQCGKSVNLSMLKYFFSDTEHDETLFSELNICEDARSMELRGKMKVIYLDFADFKELPIEHWQNAFYNKMTTLFEEHTYLLDSMNEEDIKIFTSITDSPDSNIQYLSWLIQKIREYCQQNELPHPFNKPLVLMDNTQHLLSCIPWADAFFSSLTICAKIMVGVLIGNKKVCDLLPYNSCYYSESRNSGYYNDFFGFLPTEAEALLEKEIDYDVLPTDFYYRTPWFPAFEYGDNPIPPGLVYFPEDENYYHLTHSAYLPNTILNLISGIDLVLWTRNKNEEINNSNNNNYKRF